MNPQTAHPEPPDEDDHSAYLWVDHRDEESGIVDSVSTQLAPEDALRWEWSDQERFVVWHRGQAHTIPLTFSPHDRYILASSLVELLRGRYRFLMLRPGLEGDTHAWLIVPEAVARLWVRLPPHLQALDPGFDHFGGIHVPYLNHEDAAPDFEADRARVSQTTSVMQAMVSAIFSGKMDPNASAAMAQLSLTDPALREVVAGKNQAELQAEIQRALDEALAGVPATQPPSALTSALKELQAISGRPSPPHLPPAPPTDRPSGPSQAPEPKPWWRFW